MRSTFLRPVALSIALALTAAASPAMPQSQGFPTVQTLCQPTGSQVMTVRILYTAGAVKHVHVFTPVGGGTNKVFPAPSSPTQIYTLAVPAGSWKMIYGTGGITMSTYNPVIVIPAFKVRGRFCDRATPQGTPSS